jgi:hypothetical protein
MLGLAPHREVRQVAASANGTAGRRRVSGAESEQRLKRRHGLPTPVVPKDELIEIDLQVTAADPVIRPDQPLLQIANRSVNSRQHRTTTLAYPLLAGDVAKTDLGQATERFETIGVDRRLSGDVAYGEIGEGAAAEVRNDFHSSTSRSLAPFFHRDRDKGGFPTLQLTTAAETRLGPANPGVVEFHLAVQRLPRRIHHGPAEFVEDQPGRFVPADPQLALEQQGRHPALIGRHQIGGPEPQRQRRSRPVENRSRGQRRLVAAVRTLPPAPIAQGEGPRVAAPWTAKTIRPPADFQVLPAGLIGRELPLERTETGRERRPRHCETLLIVVT